jgi:hypothetical protein
MKMGQAPAGPKLMPGTGQFLTGAAGLRSFHLFESAVCLFIFDLNAESEKGKMHPL